MAGHVFRFRFQKILDVKERKQQALEMEIGRLDRAIIERQTELQRWQRIRQGMLEDMRRARQTADLEWNARSTEYLRHVLSRIETCRGDIAGLHRNRKDVRQQLERAMRSCKVLENYRDRLKREFATAQERSQERILDLHSLRTFMRAEGAS